MKRTSIIFCCMAILASSCVTSRKARYMQTKAYDDVYAINDTTDDYIIVPDDELYLRVSSFDDLSTNFFSSTNDNRLSLGSNELTISMVSYQVDKNGYIIYPLIGLVKMGGLDFKQAADTLTKYLSNYFNQPTVIVKKVNKNVSVLGEVRLPGRYVYTKSKINILEAISMAGDITLTGNKSKVTILRKVDDKMISRKVNLTKTSFISSEDFYLKNGDIVIVDNTSATYWRERAIPINLFMSTVTTFILVLSYIKQ